MRLRVKPQRLCSKSSGHHAISFSKIYHLGRKNKPNQHSYIAVIPVVSRLSVTLPCCKVHHSVVHQSSVGHTGNWHVSSFHKFLVFIIRISIQSHRQYSVSNLSVLLSRLRLIRFSHLSPWLQGCSSLPAVNSLSKVPDVHVCSPRLQHRVGPWNRAVALQLNCQQPRQTSEPSVVVPGFTNRQHKLRPGGFFGTIYDSTSSPATLLLSNMARWSIGSSSFFTQEIKYTSASPALLPFSLYSPVPFSLTIQQLSMS